MIVWYEWTIFFFLIWISEKNCVTFRILILTIIKGNNVGRVRVFINLFFDTSRIEKALNNIVISSKLFKFAGGDIFHDDEDEKVWKDLRWTVNYGSLFFSIIGFVIQSGTADSLTSATVMHETENKHRG